ncbi:hypothetical protein VB714_26170 [Spirulina sp. 06S082]|nr:hypothetical protein [Spirulina sp. 06S082]MEA5472380.1 hypothetical protein [Spirulina sp. 06S082]
MIQGKFFQKPEEEQSDRVPPGQYLAKGFPVLTYGETPQIGLREWELRVWGLVTLKIFTVSPGGQSWMCNGRGSRLWIFSRRSRSIPKQPTSYSIASPL